MSVSVSRYSIRKQILKILILMKAWNSCETSRIYGPTLRCKNDKLMYGEGNLACLAWAGKTMLITRKII
jgi:hypothetical protein